MEKTLSLGAFEELSENESMETEGGGVLFAGLVGAVAYEGMKAKIAQYNAQKQYNDCRNKLIAQMKDNALIVTSIPKASYDYFDLPDGGFKGGY